MKLFDRVPARIVLSGLTFFGYINLYLIRFHFSVVSVAMITPFEFELESARRTLDWDERIRALILGMFNYGYCLTQIVGGRLAERYGSKYIFGISVTIPAVLNFFIPAAARFSYKAVIVIRFLQGFLQGVSWPSMHSMLAHWIPPNERSRFVGIVTFGSSLGLVFIFPLSGLLCDVYSWDVACYVTGAFPLIWGGFWFFLMHSKPKHHPRILESEKNYIEEAITEGGTRDLRKNPVPWRSIATSLPFLAIVVCEIGNSYGFTIYSSQIPNYLANIFKYSMTKTGIVSGAPFLFRYIGSCLFSFIADHLITKKVLSVAATRRIFCAIALFGPSFVMLVIIHCALGDMNAFLGLICAALFLNGSVAASEIVNYADIAPNYAGTLFGISNTVSSLVSFACFLITGRILGEEPNLQRWTIVFWACIPVMVGAEIFFLAFMSGTPQPWNFYEGKEQAFKENEEKNRRKNIQTIA